ncbi:hypothetical protein [Tsukamurella hominis]|uniref:hypothetical protein n=1 Tax=Tsukamurella hominis TaxID=1970232 RepID=UPI0039EAD767
MSLLRYLPEFGAITVAAFALAVACVAVVKAAPLRLIVAGSAAAIAAMILVPLTGEVLTRLTPRTPNIDGSLPGPVMSSVALPAWLNEVARIGVGGAIVIALVTLVQVGRLQRQRMQRQRRREQANEPSTAVGALAGDPIAAPPAVDDPLR